jgi:hypothetical protein
MIMTNKNGFIHLQLITFLDIIAYEGRKLSKMLKVIFVIPAILICIFPISPYI